MGGLIKELGGNDFVRQVIPFMNQYYARKNSSAPTLELSPLRDDTGLVGAWAIAVNALTREWPKFDLKIYAA